MSSKKNNNTDIITRFESIRKHYKLTQSQISVKLNITQGFYSDMINRGTGVSAKSIIGLALNFPEINLRWFLTGEGEMLEGGVAKEAGEAEPVCKLSETGKKIVEYIEGLPEKDQQNALSLLQGMVGLLKK